MFSKGDWSYVDLIKYLVSVKETLSAAEMDRLRQTAWLPQQESKSNPAGQNTKLKASELHEPSQIARDLDLPMLAWTGTSRWLSGSPDAKFLYSIGLHQRPSVGTVIKAAANPATSKTALNYFLLSYVAAGYAKAFDPTQIDVAFVPCTLPNGTTGLAKPSECFTNPQARAMGFSIISSSISQEDLHKFKLRSDPPADLLISKLVNTPPVNAADATQWFTYLSNRTGDFTAAHYQVLRDAKFVPVSTGDSSSKVQRFESPEHCYFTSADSPLSSIFASIFTFIDFGAGSKPFLAA